LDKRYWDIRDGRGPNGPEEEEKKEGGMFSINY